MNDQFSAQMQTPVTHGLALRVGVAYKIVIIKDKGLSSVLAVGECRFRHCEWRDITRRSLREC